jgi:hypothetical protein
MLVQKFHSDQVVDVVDKLGKLIVDPEQKAESRDIYSVGLKTMIQSVRDEDGEAISAKLVRSLIVGLKRPAAPKYVISVRLCGRPFVDF